MIKGTESQDVFGVRRIPGHDYDDENLNTDWTTAIVDGSAKTPKVGNVMVVRDGRGQLYLGVLRKHGNGYTLSGVPGLMWMKSNDWVGTVDALQYRIARGAR